MLLDEVDKTLKKIHRKYKLGSNGNEKIRNVEVIAAVQTIEKKLNELTEIIFSLQLQKQKPNNLHNLHNNREQVKK